VERLSTAMNAPGFWDDQAGVQTAVADLKRAKRALTDFAEVESRAQNARALWELTSEHDDTELRAEFASEVETLERTVRDLELRSLLSGENDTRGAILTIHPGAGGVDAQDWAEILFRMYLRWTQNHGFSTQILDQQPGEEAGIKDATIEVDGEYAYGFLKAESGVHRLVRLSPFDAAHRRHTAFASVFVFPLIDSDVNVEINEGDIRVDTFRSSGAGGQHVNKTESAVRLIHLETGIVVSCQTERSQHKNRENAMKILRARLYAHYQEKEREKMATITGEKKDIGFGHQIRSYVFQPYTIVKDHRTGEETGDVQRVLNGDIDRFIDAYLKQQRAS
jgi:peptide chain release factor 2